MSDFMVKNEPNSISVRAPPQTSLGELTTFPGLHCHTSAETTLPKLL